MYSKREVRILFAVLLIFVFSLNSGFVYNAQSSSADWDFPRLDDLYMTVAYPRTYALDSAERTGRIDNFIGMTVVNDINTLHAAPYYWNISMNPGFHMCYIGINCREVTNEDSGRAYNYHGRTPGFNLYPLNISQFRYALEVIVSGYKDAWLLDQYGFIVARQDKIIPPANAFWYNPCIPNYPSNWTLAESILLSAGFGWFDNLENPKVPGSPHSATDKWVCPNGLVLWDGSRVSQPKSDRLCGVSPNVYGIWMMCPGPVAGQSSYDLSAMRIQFSYDLSMLYIAMWNLFFCGVQAGTYIPPNDPNQLLFIDDQQSVATRISQVAFMNRDHDVYFLCWSLARNPDYLWDFFHPDADVYDGDNSPGLNHLGLNRALDTVKHWKLNDWEILADNAGPSCPPNVTVNPCTTIAVAGDFKAPVAFSVVVERLSLELGVYNEELAAPVQYTHTWTLDGNGLYHLSIHFEQQVVLNPGEAVEALFPTGSHDRLITTISEMQKVVYLAQWKLWYLAPYLPVYSRNYVNMYKTIMADNKWLEGWIDSSGYGSEPTGADMPWTTNNLHWNNQPVGGSMNYHVPGQIYTLNPIAASSSYEWQIINKIYESLYVINPYTHEDMPWIALNWTMEDWSDSNYGVENGMIMTLNLRNDTYWQDGNQITTADIAWNFDFIKSLTPPELATIWQQLIKTEIKSDYQIKLYTNSTGLWNFYKFADVALRFPKIAWEDYVGDYNATTTADYNTAVAYQPWTILRNTKPGNNGPSDLTMLYGTGPYYFRYWNKTTGKGVVKLSKNPNYWARVNVRNMQTAIGVDGLLFGCQGYKSNSFDMRIVLSNINMLSSINISEHLTTYHWVTNTYEETNTQLTLDPGQVYTEAFNLDVFPLPSVVGDLGKKMGSPPSAKWFLYDNVVDGTDLAMFLIALKGNAPILFRIIIDNPATQQETEIIRIDAEWEEP